MWKQKLGISIGNKFPIPMTDVVELLHKIGFDAISPLWAPEAELPAIVQTARECGMTVQSLHAPFEGAADMWSRDEAVSKPALDQLLQSLEAGKQLQIPILVVHTWIGFEYHYDPDTLYFQNYESLVSKAEECGIQIAFENTEGEEFLFALMEHFIDRKSVGFCWDSGHEICYNHSQDLLAVLGDRLLVTHLNDNLGISRFDGSTFWTDDLHLLPYDGVADWDWNIERLKQARKLDILNFELTTRSKPERHENDLYAQMSLELYFTEVYKRACKIGYRYANIE